MHYQWGWLMLNRMAVCLFLFFVAGGLPALAAEGPPADTASVQTTWQLLSYIAVDYSGAVANGAVISQSEYAEMTEFAQTAAKRIDTLPDKSARADLQKRVAALQRAIADKATADRVAILANDGAAELIKAYPIPLTPKAAPDLARGAQLYQTHCAACHGAAGAGDGPQAASLDPPPIAFTDRARARQRSIFGLAQVIDQGVEGTSMPSFAALPAQDRWALAFYVGGFAYPASTAAEGEQLWKSDATLRQSFDMKSLVMTTPAALAASMGEDKAVALVTYLRHHPDAVTAQQASGTLTLARTRLAAAVAAYEKGDGKQASNLALSAYLDGFEPIEPIIASRNKALMVRIETAMAQVRSSIAGHASVADVRAELAALDGLFAEAELAMAPDQASAAASFVGAFTILAREGLEALLIIVAMIAFLHKAERAEMLPYVHAGWAVALGAGALTWALATWVIAISGASRELTEGFGSVFAAVVLLWVGLWMHGKSQAQQWQHYIHDKMRGALTTRRSGWLLFGLAFVVAYREIFETILFFAALWTQGNGGAVLGGALSAVVALGVIAWILLHYSRTLPIGKFFAYSSLLIAVLAVVLIGKGVAALQEAGYLPIALLHGAPRIELLGIFPTTQGVAAQILMAMLLVAGVLWNRHQIKKA
jgi:high-affinity iron transporter